MIALKGQIPAQTRAKVARSLAKNLLTIIGMGLLIAMLWPVMRLSIARQRIRTKFLNWLVRVRNRGFDRIPSANP